MVLCSPSGPAHHLVSGENWAVIRFGIFCDTATFFKADLGTIWDFFKLIKSNKVTLCSRQTYFPDIEKFCISPTYDWQAGWIPWTNQGRDPQICQQWAWSSRKKYIGSHNGLRVTANKFSVDFDKMYPCLQTDLLKISVGLFECVLNCFRI